MCNKATVWILIATGWMAAGLFAQVLAPVPAPGQVPAPAQVPGMDWRHVGNAAIDLSLAGLATGPVDRAWYSPDGSRLLIRTASGFVFETSDFETWRPVLAPAPEAATRTLAPARLPENGARVRSSAPASTLLYAVGRFAYRSDNGGAIWDNLTAFRSGSILGEDLRDLAVSPRNEDEIVVAGG